MKRRLAWIAGGYAASAALGLALTSSRCWFVDPLIVTASSGMYAAGDLIGFVLITGTLGLVCFGVFVGDE